MENRYIYHIKRDHVFITTILLHQQQITITRFYTIVKSLPLCKKTAEALGELFAPDHSGIV